MDARFAYSEKYPKAPGSNPAPNSNAAKLLKDKRRPDGRWNLDAVHPDLEGSYANWYKKRPPTRFALETPGRPSKTITLAALRVIKRIECSLPKS